MLEATFPESAVNMFCRCHYERISPRHFEATISQYFALVWPSIAKCAEECFLKQSQTGANKSA